MADTTEEAEFNQFRKTAVDLILKHPSINQGFDLKLALWINHDLLDRYQEYRNSRAGQESPREVQIDQLICLWRSIEGTSANVNSFIEHIKEKPETKLIRENLVAIISDKNKELHSSKWYKNVFSHTADKKCALWSIVFAIQSACLQTFGIELNIEHLGNDLKDIGVKKIRRTAPYCSQNNAKVSELLPPHFDNIFLCDIEDTLRNYYSFRLRVKETSFDNELKCEIDHDAHILYEKEIKNRVLLVIHLCKNQNGDFCICADKHALENHAFNDYPRVKKDDNHILYRVTLVDFPTRSCSKMT